MGFGAGEPAEEGDGCGVVPGGFEDDGALADGRVGLGGYAGEGTDFAIVGGAGDGERDEGGLGVAGLGELGGLGDVFSDDEFGGELGGETEAFEGGGGGEAVGGVEVVGDGDLLDGRLGEGVDGEGLGWGVFARPKDEDAVGVGGGSRAGEAGGEVGGDEFFGVDEVGG